MDVSCGSAKSSKVLAGWADGVYYTDPVTSVKVAQVNDSYLVSTLDSTVRLMDKRDGKLLQTFRHSAVSAILLCSPRPRDALDATLAKPMFAV